MFAQRAVLSAVVTVGIGNIPNGLHTHLGRYYLHTAISDGIADNKKRLPESVPLIYGHLKRAGIPWSVYAGEKLASNAGFALEKFCLALKPEPHTERSPTSRTSRISEMN